MKTIERQLRLLASMAAVLFALAVATFAQGVPPPTPAAELQRMTYVLSLTEPQQRTILPILESRRSAMEALRKEHSAESRAQRHAVMEMTTREIRAVLGEEQQKAFDAMGPGPVVMVARE